MRSCYLFTKEELTLMYAMATQSKWVGQQDEFKRIMIRLCKKGYVTDTGSDYALDGIITALMKAIKDTPNDRIIRKGSEALYQNRYLWIYLQIDKHVKSGWKMQVYSGREAFMNSDEGRAFYTR